MNETTFELEPRVIGPGRRERAYLLRVQGLERDLASRAAELETSQRLERGCQRMLDRLERLHDQDRERLVLQEQQQKRLILALGAAQRELEHLRERLELERSAARALPAATPAARGWRRWFARRGGHARA